MEYVPSSTYFAEREERLLTQIAVTKHEIDTAKQHFVDTSVDLAARRDVLLSSTAKLRSERAELERRSRDAREAVRELSSLALQCETLTSELAEFLAAPDAQIAQLDAEIASVEAHQRKKTAKPAKELEKLQARMVRLRVRRTLAEKQSQPEPSSAGAIEELG